MNLSRERVLLLVLLAAVVAVWWFAWGELSAGLTITFLDVGQGDCILVQAPSGRTMLIDGGGLPGQHAGGYDIGREVVVPALLARRVKKIDVLVVTHPDEDHVGGLPAVVEAVPVGMVLDPMLQTENDSYQRLCEEIRERKITAHRATEGQRIEFGDGVSAEVLNPPDPRLWGTGSDDNNNSVVLRLVYDDMTVLLAADIDAVGVMRMARHREAIQSNILKVPHHGSAGSAVPAFLEAVRPELAVVSVGADNPYGHPSEDMLRELQRVGAKIMRTDEDGAVTVKLRPPKWWAWGYRARGRVRKLTGQAALVGVSE
ncbi:MAG: MBL fold metallo-hydrolase [Armatimonadota bacterium]|nr:MAG: MBL fold metallo-hydrolase [Armatimonadota bacterium]